MTLHNTSDDVYGLNYGTIGYRDSPMIYVVCTCYRQSSLVFGFTVTTVYGFHEQIKYGI